MDFNPVEFIFKNDVEGHLTHSEYIECPGKAFLKFCSEAKDIIEFCKQHFPKGNNSSLSKESLPKTQSILNAILSLCMGNFETYQRYLFAGIFERSSLMSDFNSENFFKAIGNKDKITIEPIHLLAYRGSSVSVGILLADNLSRWHDPKTVNEYFLSFGFKVNLYSNNDIEILKCLWQIRHSIVHTAATITKPDSQKMPSLTNFAGKNIVFKNTFMYELMKCMNRLVHEAHLRLEGEFLSKISPEITEEKRQELKNFLNVK